MPHLLGGKRWEERSVFDDDYVDEDEEELVDGVEGEETTASEESAE